MTEQTNNAHWLSCAETAKLIRKELKQQFPTTKFSVRSQTYAGGASINVHWDDGPMEMRVSAVTEPFAGGGFDGMIDMAYSVKSWLMPDGSAVFGRSNGTEGSMGSVPAFENDKPHPDAQLVSFGANFVFCNRHLSDAIYAETERKLAEIGEITGVEHNRQVLGEFLSTWVNRITALTDFTLGETIQAGIERTLRHGTVNGYDRFGVVADDLVQS